MAAITKGKSQRDRPFEVLRPLRAPLMTGMEYSLQVESTVMGGPNVPPPIPRQSLAQRIVIKNYHWSKYFSRLRNFGLRPDYPIFNGHVVVQTGGSSTKNTPRMVQHGLPGLGLYRPSKQGYMRPGGRFKKALPSPFVQYDPPIYGDQT